MHCTVNVMVDFPEALHRHRTQERDLWTGNMTLAHADQDKACKRLGQAIRRRRVEREMKAETLARLIGRTPSGVSQYELGQKEPPITVLKRIADALNTHVAPLVWEMYPTDRSRIDEHTAALLRISRIDRKLAMRLRSLVLDTAEALERVKNGKLDPWCLEE